MQRLSALVVLGALAIALLFAPLSSASIPRSEKAAPLKPLSDWLRQTGKSSVIRSRILEAMNLPARDMPVRERGFRHERRTNHTRLLCQHRSRLRRLAVFRSGR